jgi:hypothetical protein
MTKEEFRSKVIELEIAQMSVVHFNAALYGLVREYLRSD